MILHFLLAILLSLLCSSGSCDGRSPFSFLLELKGASVFCMCDPLAILVFFFFFWHSCLAPYPFSTSKELRSMIITASYSFFFSFFFLTLMFSMLPTVDRHHSRVWFHKMSFVEKHESVLKKFFISFTTECFAYVRLNLSNPGVKS